MYVKSSDRNDTAMCSIADSYFFKIQLSDVVSQLLAEKFVIDSDHRARDF